MTTTKFNVGDRVEIRIPADHALYTTQWFPKTGTITATVQKVYKNGRLMIAVDQMKNGSKDGKVSMRWTTLDYLYLID